MGASDDAVAPTVVELPLEVHDFLSWLVSERGRSRNTVAAYRRDLTGYVGWLGQRQRSVLDVAEADIAEFVAARQASGAAASSIARQLAAVRTFHRFLVAERQRPDDPTAEVEGVKVPAGLPKPLTEAEVERLIDAVTGNDAAARRDRALLELLYATGARISEAVGLSIGDLDLDAGLVRLFGKGSKERIVPFGRGAAAALEDWFDPSGRMQLIPMRWRRRDDAEAVFLNRRGGRLSRQAAWSVVVEHARRAGLDERVSP
ncbi:MAG: tyrosine-type recombinase/integrase, partial [Nocardiopsis sp. BM-2018]